MLILSMNQARFGQEIFVSKAVPSTHDRRISVVALPQRLGFDAVAADLLESTMERRHPHRQYDAEVLLAIREALRSTYNDILKQPMPHDVRAVVARLEHETGQIGPSADHCCRVPGQQPFRPRAVNW